MTYFKTARNYLGTAFLDTYGVSCSMQESSYAAEPCIWLGVDKPEFKHISGGKMYDYTLPENVIVFSRMHLNQEQARKLANNLLYFAEHGCLFNPEIYDYYKEVDVDNKGHSNTTTKET